MHRTWLLASCVALVTTVRSASPAAEPGPATKPADNAVAKAPRFELKNGDRVVLLGNTLFEREQASGHWEAALTTAFTNAEVTFRNLGWRGDTVFANSRGMSDSAAVGYERMIQQLRRLKPTVVLLGYGGVEALRGEASLSRFQNQAKKLRSELEALRVRVVWISPIRHDSQGPSLPDPASNNASLDRYVEAIAALARERGDRFVDLFHLARPEGETWTDKQTHMTEKGYERTAQALAAQLEMPSTARTIELIAGRGKKSAKGADVSVLAAGEMPILVTGDRLAPADCRLIVLGLPAGRHVLLVDKVPAATATNKEWEAGVEVRNGADAKQYAELRRAIVEKNRLYFQHWRPQDVTDLFGFRKHEQGRNAKAVVQFDKLIADAEAKIAELKYTNTRLYRIAPVGRDR